MRKKDFRLKRRKGSKYWQYKMPYMANFLTTEILVNDDDLEASEQEANQWVKDNIIDETKLKPKYLSYDDFMKKYFNGFKGNKANQNMRYGHLKNYIKPFLHNKNLLKVTAKDIEDFQENLKKKLSIQTVKHITITLSQLYYRILKAELIKRNPVFKPERNEGDILPREKEALNISDLKKLFPFSFDKEGKIIIKTLIKEWNNIYGEFQNGIYCYLLLTTGMRRNEALSIRLNSLEYDTKINHYRIRLDNILKSDNQYGKPKNNKPRFSYLIDRAYDVLKILLDRLPDNNPNAFLFPGQKENTCVSPSQMSKIVKKAFIKAGLFKDNPNRFISLHSFRHTFISILRGNIGDTSLQELAGHKSIAMLDRYDTIEAEEKFNRISQDNQLLIVDNTFNKVLDTNEGQ